MKKLFKLLSLVLLLGAAVGCKKDSAKDESFNLLSKEQKISKAQKWYESEFGRISAKLTNSKGEEAKLIFKPQWNEASVEIIDGISVISTKVVTTLQNFDNGQTKYSLVIAFTEGAFVSKVVALKETNVNEKSLFTTSELYSLGFKNDDFSERFGDAKVVVYSGLLKQERQEVYDSAGKHVIDISPKPQSQERLAVIVEVTVCTNYYLVVNVYNWNGQITGTETTYLGLYCNTIEMEDTTIDWIDNGPISGGDAYEEDEVEFGEGEAMIQGNFGIDTAALELSGVSEVNTPLNWSILKGPGYKFVSQETITSKKKLGLFWDIVGVTHNSISVQGADNKGWNVEPEFLNFTPSTNYGLLKIQMEFKEVKTKTKRGVPVTRKKTHSQEGQWLQSQFFR